MPRPMQHWLQKLNGELFPVMRQRLHEAPIRARIAAELFGCEMQVFIETGRRTVIERMCEWNFRLDPVQAEALQRQSFKKRRTCSEWMNRRADVMQKAR